MDIPQPHASRLKLGQHSPTLEMPQRLATVLGLRFVVEIAPADKSSSDPLSLSSSMELVQDITTADGSRVRVATGE